MKILITGGAGFVGSHLAEALLERGNTVYVLDNLSTGAFINIRHLEGKKNFRFYHGTVFNKVLVEEIVQGGIDFIFHLASAVGVKMIMDHPIQSLETITRGTSILLFLAHRYDVPVLLTSSSEVYGKGGKVPFCENNDIVLGSSTTRRWGYAAAKALDEFLCFAYHQETNLPIICVRLFNIVGPRQISNYGMVLPTFIRQAVSGRDITVHGDGTQSRCFCHVSDAVRALTLLSECSEASGRIVNIGTDEEVSIDALAQKIKTVTKSPSKIVYVPYEKAFPSGFEDMARRVPDLSVAKSLINYYPTFGIDEILKDAIVWTRSRS